VCFGRFADTKFAEQVEPNSKIFPVLYFLQFKLYFFLQFARVILCRRLEIFDEATSSDLNSSDNINCDHGSSCYNIFILPFNH
jgi:hypothetical protein